jgi:hypothetical protein
VWRGSHFATNTGQKPISANAMQAVALSGMPTATIAIEISESLTYLLSIG